MDPSPWRGGGRLPLIEGYAFDASGRLLNATGLLANAVSRRTPSGELTPTWRVKEGVWLWRQSPPP